MDEVLNKLDGNEIVHDTTKYKAMTQIHDHLLQLYTLFKGCHIEENSCIM